MSISADRLATLRRLAEEDRLCGPDNITPGELLELLDLADQRPWHDPDIVRPAEYSERDVEIELKHGAVIEGRYCGDNSWRSTSGNWFASANVVRWRELRSRIQR